MTELGAAAAESIKTLLEGFLASKRGSIERRVLRVFCSQIPLRELNNIMRDYNVNASDGLDSSGECRLAIGNGEEEVHDKVTDRDVNITQKCIAKTTYTLSRLD